MFGMFKQSALIFSDDRSTSFRAPNGYVGTVPDWVAKTKQAKRMVSDGTLVLNDNSKHGEKPSKNSGVSHASEKDSGNDSGKA